VANETVLFTHEQAFADRDTLHAQIRERLPEVVIIEVPAARVSLEEAIRSYLFNSQLASLPGGGMVLILLARRRRCPPSWPGWTNCSPATGRSGSWSSCICAIHAQWRRPGLRAARRAGGSRTGRARSTLPAGRGQGRCIATLIERHWPEQIAPGDIGNPDLWQQCWSARKALLDLLGFGAGTVMTAPAPASPSSAWRGWTISTRCWVLPRFRAAA
jgi:succinylarginine dihydrolase